MKKILLLNSFIAVALLMCTGCASFVSLCEGGGVDKKIHINSNPPGATVSVINGQGEEVVTTKTPAVIRLSRGTGYFQGAHYTAKFSLDGYYPSELQLNPAINGWFWGNFAIGGPLGFFIVDPFTGGMWTLRPNRIDWNLIPTSENLTPDQLKAREEEMNPVKQPAKKSEKTGSPKDSSM